MGTSRFRHFVCGADPLVLLQLRVFFVEGSEVKQKFECVSGGGVCVRPESSRGRRASLSPAVSLPVDPSEACS